VQTVIVSLVALGAFLVVVKRVLGAIRPPKGQGACPSCASGSDACGTKGTTATSAGVGGPAAPDVQPLVFVNSKAR
jgi:hypothetical protein